jgi:uncharacterized protein YkwD
VGVALKGGTCYYTIIVAHPETTTAPGTDITDAGTGESQAQDILKLVNDARTAEGICPLTMNDQLVAAAQRHANDMKNGDFLDHTGSDGTTVGNRVSDTGYAYVVVGENILSRTTLNASGAFNQWWNSPGHHDNMMNSGFTEVGIAWAGPSATGKYYYVMVLASRNGNGCAGVETQESTTTESLSTESTDGTTGGTTGGTTTGGTTGGETTGGTTGGETTGGGTTDGTGGSRDSGSTDATEEAPSQDL